MKPLDPQARSRSCWVIAAIGLRPSPSPRHVARAARSSASGFVPHPIGESSAPLADHSFGARLRYRGGCWFGPLIPQLPTDLQRRGTGGTGQERLSCHKGMTTPLRCQACSSGEVGRIEAAPCGSNPRIIVNRRLMPRQRFNRYSLRFEVKVATSGPMSEARRKKCITIQTSWTPPITQFPRRHF